MLIMWRLLLLGVRQVQYRQGILRSQACLNNIVVNIVEAIKLHTLALLSFCSLPLLPVI